MKTQPSTSQFTLRMILFAGTISIAGQAQAVVLLQDTFGVMPSTGAGTRFDAAGNPVPAGDNTPLDGIRAEAPFTANEVWVTPTLRNVPSWVIGKGPGDPFETYGTPSEPTKADDFAADLFVDAGDTQPPGLSAALLNFTPPTGAFQASLDTIVGGGAGTLGIGFTTSTTTLFDNFQQFGQASLTLTGLGAGRGGVATWTLRTDGISGPSLSGTFVMQDWLPMALSYDPLTHTVQGSVDGVLTGALDYTATGITGVGFEGIGHVDNFLVQTGALSGAVGVVPEPAGWAMMIAGFGGVGALARGRRRRTAALTVASDPRAA